MIYTMGYALSYRKGLLDLGNNFRKLGRTDTYSGGCAWKTAAEAWAYILSQGKRLKNYSVWEIDADWLTDTAENREGYPWHDLLITSRIVREIPIENVQDDLQTFNVKRIGGPPIDWKKVLALYSDNKWLGKDPMISTKKEELTLAKQCVGKKYWWFELSGALKTSTVIQKDYVRRGDLSQEPVVKDYILADGTRLTTSDLFFVRLDIQIAVALYNEWLHSLRIARGFTSRNFADDVNNTKVLGLGDTVHYIRIYKHIEHGKVFYVTQDSRGNIVYHFAGKKSSRFVFKTHAEMARAFNAELLKLQLNPDDPKFARPKLSSEEQAG